MSLQTGDTLLDGRYRILGHIGQGGFAVVYHARDTLLDFAVAIKELVPSAVGDPEKEKRFLREARATLKLRHDNIVTTYHLFKEKGSYYLVMEYMPGGSLEDVLQQKHHLPVDETVRIAREVCKGLSYAHTHENGIIHCDLKPANILFADGTAKIADFGIAHISSHGPGSQHWATTAPFFAGTLAYMSPDQVGGDRSDPRIDLYALGATLYHALTGHPYADFRDGATPADIGHDIDLIQNHQPVRPSTHNRLVPPWLDDLVLRLLAKRPEDRPDTAAEVCALLGPRPTQPLPLTSPPPPWWSRLPKWAWFVLAGALLVVLGVAAWCLLVGCPFALCPLPEGGRIAFASGADSPQIYVMNADGSCQTRLTDNGSRNESPAWSPDGKRLAYHSWQDGNAEVYVMNVDGTELKNLTTHTDDDGSPSWSPDGKQITFDSNRDGNTDIWVMNADGSEPTKLTDNQGGNSQPAWSPDGMRIAFMSGRDGNAEIYVMDADGSNQMRLTDNADTDESPAWSPDGELIAFFSYSDETPSEIYVMEADGTEVRRLTDNSWSDGSPSWSPDGQRISFDSKPDGNWEIYVMNADGSEQVNLTKSLVDGLDDRLPAWGQ